MPEYNFIALDAHGAEHTGQLIAPDVRHATVKLRTRGLFPTKVDARTAAGNLPNADAAKFSSGVNPPAGRRSTAGPTRWQWPGARRVRPKELVLFTRQLATLTHAGMPLLRGLEVLARQEKNRKFQAVITELAVAIKSGDTFSGALANYPREFGRLFLSMIKAGEAAGALDVVLDRLARFQEKALKLKGRITTALVYPVIVLAVAGGILCGLLVFVVPKFKIIFSDLLKGAPLPPLTQAVLVASDAVKSHVLLIAAVAIVGWCIWKFIRRLPRIADVADRLIIRVPLFGELVLKGIVARFSRTLGTLLASGVPILPALLITREACENRRIAAAITQLHDQVKEGAAVARTLEKTGCFPPMVASMIEVGEHTGQLAEMLGKVADIYEEEVDNAAAGLSALIEPLLIVFLAVVVGTIVIALFLPIIRIVQLMT